MQQSNDGRRSNRPNLLSDPTEGDDKLRILNRLDVGKERPHQGGKLAIAGALLLFGGAVGWGLQHQADTSNDGHPYAPQMSSQAAVAASSPLSSMPPPVEDAPSAATIFDPLLEDLPARQRTPALPVRPNKPARLAQAVANPVVLKSWAQPTEMPQVEKPSETERDETLLAALLAHSKTPATRESKTAIEYKRCATLSSVAESDACRARLCEASPEAQAECESF